MSRAIPAAKPGVWRPSWVRLFEAGFRPWMRRRLGGLHLDLPATLPPPGASWIFVANHVSWWDGFLVREVQRRLRSGTPLYTLMGRAERDRFSLLRRLGVEALEPSRPAALVPVVRRLQARAAVQPICVSIFPQGSIWPASRRPLGFVDGAVWLAQRLPEAWFVPVAIRFEPLQTPSPHAFVRAGAAVPAAGTDAAALDRRVAALLDGIERHLLAHGEAAASAWDTGRMAA